MGRFNHQFFNANKLSVAESNVPTESTKKIETDIGPANFSSISVANKTSASDISVNKNEQSVTRPIDLEKREQSISVQPPTTLEKQLNTPGQDVSQKKYIKLDVNKIEYAADNPFRKRDTSDSGKEQLDELAKNIAIFGLLHPLLVNKVGDRYILISGERRLKAVRKLGWEQVDCMLTEVTDNNIEKGMLRSANIEIRTISPFDMFSYIYELMEIYQKLATSGDVKGGKYKYISDCLSISKRQVVKYTSIMNNIGLLSADERFELENNNLSINRAYEIIKERKNRRDYNSEKPNESNVTKDNKSETKDDSINENKKELEAGVNIETSEGLQTTTIDLSNSDEIESIEEAEDEPEPEPDNNTEQIQHSSQSKELQSNSIVTTPIYKDFIDALFNPSQISDAQLYEGISMVNGKKVFGLLVITAGKSYITFPSNILSLRGDKEHTRDITFNCVEIQKGSERRRKTK